MIDDSHSSSSDFPPPPPPPQHRGMNQYFGLAFCVVNRDHGQGNVMLAERWGSPLARAECLFKGWGVVEDKPAAVKIWKEHKKNGDPGGWPSHMLAWQVAGERRGGRLIPSATHAFTRSVTPSLRFASLGAISTKKADSNETPSRHGSSGRKARREATPERCLRSASSTFMEKVIPSSIP